MELKGDIKRIGNLSLGYKTFLFKDTEPIDLEICMWLDDNTKYTIASFDYDEFNNLFELNSCADRLNNTKINWEDFGKLVLEGYKILEVEARIKFVLDKD